MKEQNFSKDAAPAEVSFQLLQSRRPGWTSRIAGYSPLLELVKKRRIYLGLLITMGQAAWFFLQQQVGHWLFLMVVLPGLLMGFGWQLLDGPEKHLERLIAGRLDRVLTGFCLFFIYLVLYIPLVSVTVSYPVGLFIGALGDPVDLAGDYMLYSVNSVFFMVAFSWYQWWTSGRDSSRSSLPPGAAAREIA